MVFCLVGTRVQEKSTNGQFECFFTAYTAFDFGQRVSGFACYARTAPFSDFWGGRPYFNCKCLYNKFRTRSDSELVFCHFLLLTDKAMFQFITIVLTLATISAHGEENIENQFDFNIANTDTVSQSKQI